MPFPYLGAKHSLAHLYPPPVGRRIVEPFAGAAGYSCYWATLQHQVVLVDRDPAVVELWHLLQRLDQDDVRVIRSHLLTGSRSNHPVLGSMAGPDGLRRTLDGGSVALTTWMIRRWPPVWRRIQRVLPMVRRWDVRLGDWSDAPAAAPDTTTFVDPPYQSVPWDGYRWGADRLDYGALGAWCQARRGQVIVCEEGSATWLPFRPVGRRKYRIGGGAYDRAEAVWTRTPGAALNAQVMAAQRARAKARRRA